MDKGETFLKCDLSYFRTFALSEVIWEVEMFLNAQTKDTCDFFLWQGL